MKNQNEPTLLRVLHSELMTNTSTVSLTAYDSDYNSDIAEAIDEQYDQIAKEFHQYTDPVILDRGYIKVTQVEGDSASFRITIQHDSTLIKLEII